MSFKAACFEKLSSEQPLSASYYDSSDFSIFNWNARSIRNKTEYLMDIADEYNILCLTETHLDNNIHTQDILLDNFSSPFRKDRTFAGGGS